MSTIEKTYSKSRRIIKTFIGGATILFGFLALVLFSPSHIFSSTENGVSQELINSAHADAYNPINGGTYDPGAGGTGGGGEGSGCGDSGSCSG